MRSIFLLLLLVFTGATQARWLTKQESGSVIEKFHVDQEVFKNGSWSQTVDYVIRVQSEDAKVNASIFAVDYNAFTDQVEILEAYTLNGKQKIKVDPSAIEDRDKGESKDYDVMKTKSVVFPKVQIGSRLHVRYRMKTTKPLIEDRWSTEVSLAPGYFIESFRFQVKSELPLFAEVKDPRGLLRYRQASANTFEARNRKTIPGWVHAEKDPFFHPAGETEIWLTTHKDWSVFFASLAKDFDRILATGVPKDLKPWVKQAAKKKTNAEKIEFLLTKMSHEFRYFGDWRRHNGGLVPRPLHEIEDSRYGDCKDLSVLLVAMLRELGLQADVALVRRGDNPWGEEPDYKLPAINRFNHAIAYVKDGKSAYWLDATNPVMSLKPYPDISGRPAWLLGGRFERLPPSRAQDFLHVHEYEYRFDGDDTVKVRVNATLKDHAGYDIANELMLAPRTDVLSDTLEYFSEGQEVKSHRYVKEPKTSRMLSDMNVVLEYEAGRVFFTAGKASFWVMPDGFLQGAFYETEDRESDLDLGGEPYIFRGVRRLKDTRLAQEPPPPCRIDSRWMSLERKVEVLGKDVVITQNVELRQPFIRRDEFRSPAFKKLQAETKRCFYRSGVLIEPLKRTLSMNAR